MAQILLSNLSPVAASHHHRLQQRLRVHFNIARLKVQQQKDNTAGLLGYNNGRSVNYAEPCPPTANI